MTLGEQFTAFVSDVCVQRRHLDQLPDVLAQSCVSVLGVSGAGISMMMDDLRVPLGASDDEAACAEKLQVTLGQGPCLDALGAGRPQVFDLTTMAERWPAFYGEVIVQTSFRAFASVPLRPFEVRAIGALDLYSTSEHGLDALVMAEIGSVIGGAIASLLFDAPASALQRGVSLPLWLGHEGVANRMDVWVAVGMVMEGAELTKGDALAAIRAYAVSHRTSLDDVAHQIADEQLTPQRVLG